MKCEVKNTLEFNLKKCFTKPCVVEYLKSEELNVNLSHSNKPLRNLSGVDRRAKGLPNIKHEVD